jgi:hypothetical protein
MKAYELLAQVKDLALISSTGRDNAILQKMALLEQSLYNMEFHWRCLETHTDIYTGELMTLNVAPATPWAVGDTITGVTSTKTCVITSILSTTTYLVKDRSGTFTLGEVLTNGTTTADQGVLYPTFADSSYNLVPADIGTVYTVRQMSNSPYDKVRYIQPHKFHEIIPQPTIYASNRPRYYTWFGGKFWWYPIPDDTYTMTLFYYKRPAALKTYAVGTAVVSGGTITGTSTYWLNNANVSAGMYFAYPADVRTDGTYPWAKISSVGSNTAITLETAYGGATATGAYIISSDMTFSDEFMPYLLYSISMLEGARNRELQQMTAWYQSQIKEQLMGLIQNQTSLPDFIDVVADFSREPMMLGDDYAKFPFITGNP